MLISPGIFFRLAISIYEEFQSLFTNKKFQRLKQATISYQQLNLSGKQHFMPSPGHDTR